MQRLAAALDVTEDYLLGYTDKPQAYALRETISESLQGSSEITSWNEVLLEHYYNADKGTQMAVEKLLDMPERK